jgi:hypothetical protein
MNLMPSPIQASGILILRVEADGTSLEGRSSFTEALRLLGFKKMATFRELEQTLGLAV